MSTKAPKTFTITVRRNRYGRPDSTYEHTGTLPELIECFRYTLETGESYQHEKGNKKINTLPKGIKSLVTNLNNATNNAAANGYSGTSYYVKE